jgi:hypothetical protein
MLDIVVGILAVGHIVKRDIRDFGKRIVERLRSRFLRRFELWDGFF